MGEERPLERLRSSRAPGSVALQPHRLQPSGIAQSVHRKEPLLGAAQPVRVSKSLGRAGVRISPVFGSMRTLQRESSSCRGPPCCRAPPGRPSRRRSSLRRPERPGKRVAVRSRGRRTRRGGRWRRPVTRTWPSFTRNACGQRGSPYPSNLPANLKCPRRSERQRKGPEPRAKRDPRRLFSWGGSLPRRAKSTTPRNPAPSGKEPGVDETRLPLLD